MSINTYFKAILFASFSIITFTTAAMDYDLVETRIISMFERPLDYQQIDRLSKDLKLISVPKPQKAADFLDQAYIMLISENKFDLASKLLLNLEEVPQLKKAIEQLKLDLAKKISVQPFREEQKVSEAELASEQVSQLLRKEHFLLEDAKEISNIIQTAIANNWKINIPKLVKLILMRALTSFIAGSLDNRIIAILTATIKKEFIKSASGIRASINEIFEKMIPFLALTTAIEKQRNYEFITAFLDSLLKEQIINQAERDSYFKSYEDPELEPIIAEHSIDKSVFENSRVELTITGGKLVPLLNFPTYTTIKQESIIIGAQQMKALSQREYYGIRPEIIAKLPIVAIPSTYCGYYAAYNLWCIITNQQTNIMNRKLFAEHFGAMLVNIKKRA